MRLSSWLIVGCALVPCACAELQGVVDEGVAEGRRLAARFAAWIEEGDRPDGEPGPGADPDVLRVNDPRYSHPETSPDPAARASGAPGSFGAPGAYRSTGQPGAAAATGDPVARQRFAAAYALLACAQDAAVTDAERERRRTALFERLGYTNFAWLDDLQRFGTAEGDALKALCRP
jgi:hypothetical protein